jgi:DNA-binding transcriptional ArsR family regulator
MKGYIVRDKDRLEYDDALFLNSAESIQALDNPLRRKILQLISQKPMYPMQIAKKLKLHEQKVYYHIRILQKEGFVELAETKEVRGTIAKSFRAASTNFIVQMGARYRPIEELWKSRPNLSFFEPFASESLNAKVVVGSPDPHGPHKARARDGHYAVDLGVFLGSISSLPKHFSVNLDVDVQLDKAQEHLILVGGPVTNLLTAQVNAHLPKRFSDERPWGIKGLKLHTDDNVGLIARIQNPFQPSLFVLIAAGIRFSGTKAAVMGLTRFTKTVLTHFTGQKAFCAIVQGFDMDGDGRIDSVELLE